MSSTIRTLDQLKQEKQKIKMEMEVSKKAFINSFGTTKSQAKDFLVKKVAIPAGAVGLVTLGAKQFLSSNSPRNQVVNRSSNYNYFLTKLIPLALPFIQSYLAEPKRLKKLPPIVQEIIAPKVAVKKARRTESV